MTWRSRLKLIGGLFLVACTIYGLLIILNHNMNTIESRSAKLGADTYTIGTDYSGIVTKQYVSEGQRVSAGQPLFRIKSTLLANDLSSGSITKNDVAFSIDSDNQVVLKATNAGIVSNIDYIEGAFVPANKEVASIVRDDSTYVEAAFTVNPPDYARIHTGDILTVTLPNNQKVRAAIYGLAVSGNASGTQTIITARIQKLGKTQFTIGTPVTAELRMDGKSLYNTTKEMLQRLVQPKQ